MSGYLPTPHDLAGAAGLVVVLSLLLVLGACATVRRTWPEFQIAAGWGVTCIALTVWGIFTVWPMWVPAAVLGGIAALVLFRREWRGRIGNAGGLWRVAILSLPLWLVMIPSEPSQIDTWLNLLPNAAYLFDHHFLPAASRPESYSFLPVAPYSTQFVAYLASLASGSLAGNAMALFNIALLCLSGLLLARVLAGPSPAAMPPWWACATGLLLAVPLNPGFVPEVFFSAYGEASLAVTTMFAVWLSAEVLTDLAKGKARPQATVSLALVLTALVNIKQSGVGLLLPILVTMLVLALMHPAIPRRRGLVAVATAGAPALALYLLWRWYAVSSFTAGELEPLPLSAWNFDLLPQILLAMAVTVIQKATFFVFLAVSLGGCIWCMGRAPWTRNGMLGGMIIGVTVLFNFFLLFTYIAHFPPPMAIRAHSYFRYSSQLSLAAMLGLVVIFRPAAVAFLTRRCRALPRLTWAPVLLILVLPVAAFPMLRFDLDAPQPVLRRIGHLATAYIEPGSKLALLVNGDVYDSVGSMLRGVLMFTPPRRPGLQIRTETTADAATLRKLAADGYHTALVTCTPAPLGGAPPGVAALLRDSADGWHPIAIWHYPAELKTKRFAAMLSRKPFCAAASH
jgi:hypothetical protein